MRFYELKPPITSLGTVINPSRTPFTDPGLFLSSTSPSQKVMTLQRRSASPVRSTL